MPTIQLSQQTIALAQLIQANSKTPMTWRQAVRRALLAWECDRVIQEGLADLLAQKGQQLPAPQGYLHPTEGWVSGGWPE